MKNLFLPSLLLASSLTFGQAEMRQMWQQNPDHKIYSTGVARWEDGYNYVASEKTITVYTNKDGAVKWTKAFSDIGPKLNKVDDIIPMWNAGVLLLCDRRFGKDQICGVEVETGKNLWQTEAYQGVDEDNVTYLEQSKLFLIGLKKSFAAIDAKSGELKWQTTRLTGAAGFSVETGGFVTILNYKPTALGALFAGFKNQLVKIDVKTGEVAWETTYRGAFEKKVISREPVGSMKVTGDEILLMMSGIQVFDFATGKPKWSAAYDQTPAVIRKPAMQGIDRFGAYGTVADPVIDGDFVYVLDVQNKRKQYVKKYNRLSGELVWTSDEIDDAKVIPGMFVHKDRVLLQVGGTIEIQYHAKRRLPDGDIEEEWAVDFDEYGPYNLQGFDAGTGKSVWQSEKLRKGLANAYMADDKLIAASGKSLYSFDYATGKEFYEIPLGKDNISTCNYIAPYKDKVVVVGDKGVATHSLADGKMVTATKYKRAVPVKPFSSSEYVVGSSITLRNKDGDFAVYDLDKGTYQKYDGRKNARATLSSDGDALYVFESGNMLRKSKVTRLATR